MSRISPEMLHHLESAILKTGLTIDYANYLQEIAHLKRLTKKEFLITEGRTCNFLGVVLSGKFRCFVTNESGEFNTDFFFEGDFITALTSYLVQRPTSFNIEALTNCTVLLLPGEQYQELIRMDPVWTRLNTYITETFFVRKCRREISFLKESAAERLETLTISFPGIEQKVSQYHIASYLGIRPESLSRIKLGLITHR